MTEEQLKIFLDKFDENDTEKKGSINFDQFKAFFPDVMGGNTSDESAEMYFRGINVNNTGKISRQEFSNFVTAVLKNDQDFLIKSAFRSFDKDQSQNLNCEEVKAITKYVGRDMSDDEIAAAMEKITGSKKGCLTYEQVYKMITGIDLGGGKVAGKASTAANNNNNAANNNNGTVGTTIGDAVGTVVRSQSVPDAPQTPEEIKKKSSCCLLI